MSTVSVCDHFQQAGYSPGMVANNPVYDQLNREIKTAREVSLSSLVQVSYLSPSRSSFTPTSSLPFTYGTPPPLPAPRYGSHKNRAKRHGRVPSVTGRATACS